MKRYRINKHIGSRLNIRRASRKNHYHKKESNHHIVGHLRRKKALIEIGNSKPETLDVIRNSLYWGKEERKYGIALFLLVPPDENSKIYKELHARYDFIDCILEKR